LHLTEVVKIAFLRAFIGTVQALGTLPMGLVRRVRLVASGFAVERWPTCRCIGPRCACPVPLRYSIN
jgi:hypothetical protein